MRAEMAVEILAYSPLSYLTRLITREHFIHFSSHESLNLCMTNLCLYVCACVGIRVYLFGGGVEYKVGRLEDHSKLNSN
jgi:hypothetical protein